MDIIIKSDEWNVFDVMLARKILADMGKPVTEEAVALIAQQRIDELSVVEPPQTSWIIAGYLLAFCGGVLGFFIGWHLSTFKRTLPNGNRLFAYSSRDRLHGKIIFYLSFVGFAIAVLIKLNQTLN